MNTMNKQTTPASGAAVEPVDPTFADLIAKPRSKAKRKAAPAETEAADVAALKKRIAELEREKAAAADKEALRRMLEDENREADRGWGRRISPWTNKPWVSVRRDRITVRSTSDAGYGRRMLAGRD
jgi:hypothetical protein